MTWFARGGDEYAAHRPTYSGALASVLSSLAPDRELAVDVGCGTGQLTALLAEHFDAVVGVDPSQSQIAAAVHAPNIEYRVGPAERLDVADGSASIVTAAQAAHWFDLPAFYDEARRIARAGAVIALITYGVVALDDDLAERFDRFYRDEIGPYWPPERVHVDSAYADLPFPFARVDVSVSPIERDWTLDDFVDYVGTWSATRRARDAGAGHLVESMRADFASHWGDRRRITWPVTVIAGKR
ncbi:class I SAM-dependent methyltransferase [Gordonia sp. MP11Mi]|uniref:Methyltransferase type 11 domain-containing protein n=1 Tax=Gordonia sp. MP11Mi TaxID=3022769 RepID=A0AA97CY23_9ACTN